MTKLLCPKNISCSAPICPIDKDRHLRKHMDGDGICFYLSELSKPTRDNLKQAIDIKLYLAIAAGYPVIYSSYGLIKKRLDRSSRTPSRLAGDV